MESQGLPDYRWTPLTDPKSSTRLFTLLPGAPGTPIQCKLFEVDLTVKQSYTALSYEWGPRTSGCAMRVDDGLYYIQKNLNAFLCQLRSRLPSDQTLTLWVDAICIDQASTEEKNHQVRMMGKIFSQAEEVIAWLGEGNDRISRLFERVDGSSLRHDFESQINDDPCEIYRRATEETGSAVTPLDEVWGNESYEEYGTDLLALGAASYWYRAWIVQEFVLARKISVLCGTAHISDIGVVTLFLIISRFWAHGESILKELTRLSMVLLNRVRFQNKSEVGASRGNIARQEWMSLAQLIQNHSHSETHDPRDKVYAFVGMAQDLRQDSFHIYHEREPDFVVDYNKNIHQITIEIICDHVQIEKRSVDGYFRIMTALLESELQQHDSLPMTLEWTNEFFKSCQQTLLPHVLGRQLRVRLWLAGRVSLVAGLLVAIKDIPNYLGPPETARDYATSCEHICGEPVEPGDIVLRLRSTQLCLAYRVIGNRLHLIAMLVVTAHPVSQPSVGVPRPDIRLRAQLEYVRSGLFEGLEHTTETSDSVLSSSGQRDLTKLSAYELETIYITAFISVADFLVIVKADFAEYIQRYHELSLARGYSVV